MEKIGAVLVVGGGIAGIQSSLDLAESGFKVYLLEKSAGIGGVMSQLDKTFPTNDCSMCILSPKLVETGRNPNINLIINSQILGLEGEAGNFQVRLLKNPLYINQDACTGCGVCAQECPMESIDIYNEKMVINHAISVKYPQSVPLIFSINKEKCIGCGICQSVCKAHAVEYSQEKVEEIINIGAIILAPGFDEFDPSPLKMYGYGKYKNVVSSIEFERILSASGPYSGMVLRPSDGEIPEKVAFIQCVGSRDVHHAHPYCSSVCCMYTAKEAVIAKEHQHQVNPTIFTMDIRAYGKDFDKYIDRAKDEYGIKYIRSRISSIAENPDNDNLILNYEVEDGTIKTEEYNMVVLSVGLTPPSDAIELSKVLGIELNEYNFCQTDTFEQSKTSKPGIYVCGAFSSPKDIPESVIQASASAAHVNILLNSARNTLVTKKELPPERNVQGDPPKIGVFICHCGINIGGVVDVPGVVEYASKLENVEYSEDNLYTCSADTQQKIVESVQTHDLNRVIVASCTPRTHEPLFQQTLQEAGLNPYLFEMANIRDQCSWVHMHEPEAATQKAKDLVRMAVAKANKIEPLKRTILKMSHKVLVIGGGISGLTAALGFAKQGFHTYILEKTNELGGFAKNIHEMLTHESVQDYISNLINQTNSNPKLDVYLGTEIESIDGFIGNFKTTIHYIDNGERKETTLEHGIIIVATGGVPYEPTEYLYSKDPRVITQIEFEKQLFKKDIGSDVQKIVMIQCIGSRNEEYPYCSRVCCSEAIKNALKLKELYPEKEVIVLYRDIRTYGLKEKFYREARIKGVLFIHFEPESPPELEKINNNLILHVNSPNIGSLDLNPDLLVLSVGIRPPYESNEKLAPMLKVPLNSDKFYLEAHVKLRPVDFATEGIFLCGLAHSPRTIDESIMQANATVSRALTYLSKDEIETEGIVASINAVKCSGCGLCIEICAYNAITMNEERNIAEINSALCKGCGACAASCRGSAIDLFGFTNEEMYLVINELK
ncbi:MAG: CoB--CoM heterodisulfide reductase iron-sulfur subunit A family protein [Candidatus Lokiarchaeota archaeon]|nr:CoB--CoM heterodisulfide reductase iron-sulfur subunit A family protein [Candidatus Harpocratesius repetitus]